MCQTQLGLKIWSLWCRTALEESCCPVPNKRTSHWVPSARKVILQVTCGVPNLWNLHDLSSSRAASPSRRPRSKLPTLPTPSVVTSTGTWEWRYLLEWCSAGNYPTAGLVMTYHLWRRPPHYRLSYSPASINVPVTVAHRGTCLSKDRTKDLTSKQLIHQPQRTWSGRGLQYNLKVGIGGPWDPVP